MSTPTLLGRPPERTEHIVRELRGQITRGDLAPGVQLPTRIEIEQHFGASSVTVQRALQELQRDGFVRVNGRRGTFVSSQPPHLTNYALVFPTLPDMTGWNRFFGALDCEAPSIAQKMGWQISTYYGVDSHSSNKDYLRLLADVKAQRLAGIIFASLPMLVRDTPIVNHPNVPRVAIMVPSTEYDMPQINLDRTTLWNRCAEVFLAQGRRNLAILMPPVKADYIHAAQQTMLNHGFHVPPQWVQIAPGSLPDAARNLTHLLFENGRNRPDAFFITDDNLVENALTGLLAAGVKVPEEVEVVAHCNFPHPVPASVPVRRLGFDARRVLQACFDDLEGQRSGREVPSVTPISAQFEEEIATNSLSF